MKPHIRKLSFSLLLIFSVLCNTEAQYFVKQIDGAGTIEPKIFGNTAVSPDYYITARSGDSTIITKVNAAGAIITTQIVKFTGDVGTIRDMVVDWVDGTLAGIAIGNNKNFVFKYNFVTQSFNWVKSYPSNYVFQNIHQVSGTKYVITGEIYQGRTTIFEVIRATGIMGYQYQGFAGEFFSTFDGTDIYGACRYYSGSSTFNPSLYRHNASTGTNTWTNTYVSNFGVVRIYPVAPVVDGGDLVMLSSGDATNGFNTYLTGPTDVWLLKTDLAGTLQWTKKIKIPGYARLNAKKIINTASGYYLLIDSYNPSSAIVNYFFIIKTDKAGNIRWTKRYGVTGQNSVISGVENNGDLLLTANSGNFNPGSNTLFLKLDPQGMAGFGCPYIAQTTPTITASGNTQQAKSVLASSTAYTNANQGTTQSVTTPTEQVFCSGSGGGGGGGGMPCGTLTGSLATGVLAFYPFGMGSLSDLSGNGLNLTNNTSATPTFDRNGNPKCAYSFVKTNNDSLTIPASGTWFLNGLTGGAFSISLWYQATGTRPVNDYELLIGRGSTPVHCPDTWGEWSVGLYDCRRAVVGFDQYAHWESYSGMLSCSQLLTAISNNWHHLAFVYDGISTYDLYIDGVLSSSSTGPCGALSANAGPLTIGKDYTGDLDDIIIYNRALQANEVSALMALNGSCCDGITSSVRVAGTTQLNENEKEKSIEIYPNPSDGQLMVSSGSIIRNVAVYNSAGILVGTYRFNQSKVSLDITSLTAGLYFIRVRTDSGDTVEKLIKN